MLIFGNQFFLFFWFTIKTFPLSSLMNTHLTLSFCIKFARAYSHTHTHHTFILPHTAATKCCVFYAPSDLFLSLLFFSNVEQRVSSVSEEQSFFFPSPSAQLHTITINCAWLHREFNYPQPPTHLLFCTHTHTHTFWQLICVIAVSKFWATTTEIAMHCSSFFSLNISICALCVYTTRAMVVPQCTSKFSFQLSQVSKSHQKIVKLQPLHSRRHRQQAKVEIRFSFRNLLDEFLQTHMKKYRNSYNLGTNELDPRRIGRCFRLAVLKFDWIN